MLEYSEKDLQRCSRGGGVINSGIFHRPVFHVGLIVFLSVLAYSNTFHVPFLWDDGATFFQTDIIQYIQNPGKLIESFFSCSTPPHGLAGRRVGFITFAANYALSGYTVTSYHVVNLAIHIINGILVYFLVVLTGRTPAMAAPGGPGLPNSSPLRLVSLFTALLFVCHPLQTQAVTYIMQRAASLATLFYLLAITLYIQARLRWREPFSVQAAIVYAFSILSAALAMETKQISFTLPAAVILYEFLFFSGKSSKRFLCVAPLILTMAIIPLGMLDISRPAIEVLSDIDQKTRLETGLSRVDYLITQFRVITTYLRLLVLPVKQNIDYDFPLSHSLFEPGPFLSMLLLALIAAGGGFFLYRSRRNACHGTTDAPCLLRLAAFGIFWFFITLTVESSIIPIVDVIFEHRVYLPSVGAFITAASLLFLLRQKLIKRWPAADRAFHSTLAVIILLLAATAYARNGVWRDGVTLWEDAVRKSPGKGRAWSNLGSSYKETNQVEKAYAALTKAILLDPKNPYAWNNLGAIRYQLGHDREAEEALRTALQLNFTFPAAWKNLGLVQERLGDTDGAIKSYQYAIAFSAHDVEARVRLHNILDHREGKSR